MTRKAEPLAVITESSYRLAVQALADVSVGQASMSRIAATFSMGGREAWVAIVHIWDDVALNHPDLTIKKVAVYRDGHAEITADQ